MIAWVNFGVLIVSAVLFICFYVKSVRPAALERQIGPRAYHLCARYRAIASASMLIAAANYVIYYWHPLPVPLPRTFPWAHPISGLIALAIAVPSGYLMGRAVKDAGEETMRPRKEHRLHGGIYQKMRHPQAVGEVFLWWVLAFLLHSPFLALFSLVWLPVCWYFCRAEEQDLLLRYGQAYEEYRRRTGTFWPKAEGERSGH